MSNNIQDSCCCWNSKGSLGSNGVGRCFMAEMTLWLPIEFNACFMCALVLLILYRPTVFCGLMCWAWVTWPTTGHSTFAKNNFILWVQRDTGFIWMFCICCKLTISWLIWSYSPQQQTADWKGQFFLPKIEPAVLSDKHRLTTITR